MAQIFPAYAGQQFGNWGEAPWLDCVLAFDIDDTCRTEGRPAFQREDGRGGLLPDCVVIRLEEPEAAQHRTAPGYFLSPLDGRLAKMRLDELRGAGNARP